MTTKQRSKKENLRGEGRTVPIHLVSPNGWNPNRQTSWMFEKQKHSLETFAQSAPILVRRVPLRGNTPTSLSADGSPQALSGTLGEEYAYEIVDGEHRWRAAQELGWDEVSVWDLGNLTDAESKQLTVIMNELSGSPEIDELAILLADLDESIGRDVLVDNMPFTEEQIDDLIATIDFSWTNFEAEEDEEEAGEAVHMVRLEFRMTENEAKVVEQALTRTSIEQGLELTNDVESRTQVLLALCAKKVGE